MPVAIIPGWGFEDNGGKIAVKSGGASIMPGSYSSVVTLNKTGVTQIATVADMTYVQIGVVNTAASGPILIYFHATDAATPINGTPGSEAGMVLGPGLLGDVYIVSIPVALRDAGGYFSLAENAVTATGKVLVTQGN